MSLKSACLLAAVTSALLGSFAAPALAAGPYGPTLLKTEGFEAASTNYTITGAEGVVAPSTGKWARQASRRHRGTYGLWCAGTTPFGTYPAGSHGAVMFDLPLTKDYYESKVSFYYTMPSLGADDGQAFGVYWKSAADGYNDSDIHYAFPKTSTNVWRFVEYDMSAGANAPLSRRSGKLYFKWRDTYEASSTVTVGEGPSIDDVRVTGYKYGPVRYLAASRVGGDVRLTWSKPYARKGATTLESRAISYRVYRLAPGDTAWRELTTARITGTTFTDATAVSTGGYRYAVQTWDAGTATGHGRAMHVDIGDARFSGADSFAASAAYSRLANPSPLHGEQAVIIVNGNAWPDALGASALAGAVNAPLLMVAGAPQAPAVPTVVATEITRLGATKAYIIGGTTSVPVSIETRLLQLGVTKIERLAGADRYITSQRVAAKVADLRGKGGNVFITTGLNYPDALSASSLAARLRAPIILTKPAGLPAASQAALKSVRPTRVTICGGTTSVSNTVASQVKSLIRVTPVRKGGADRYTTAKLVIDYGISTLVRRAPSEIYIASGRSHADALAGGPVAGLQATGWQPLMLTEAAALVTPAQDLVRQQPTIRRGVVFGTTAKVSSAAMKTLTTLIP